MLPSLPSKIPLQNWVWWHMPVIPGLGRLRIVTNSRPAWATKWAPDQTELRSETFLKKDKKKKNPPLSQVWWRGISAMQPGLHCKFKTSQHYTARFCFKTKQNLSCQFSGSRGNPYLDVSHHGSVLPELELHTKEILHLPSYKRNPMVSFFCSPFMSDIHSYC